MFHYSTRISIIKHSPGVCGDLKIVKTCLKLETDRMKIHMEMGKQLERMWSAGFTCPGEEARVSRLGW